MVRVLRYPRLCVTACVGVLITAVLRDLCVSAGLDGWARVLLVITLALLLVCFALMSCRFFVDETGVGIGSLWRVRRAQWHELSSLGVLCCNSRRAYLYGLYRSSPDFLQLLHRAPHCGSGGFVVPTSRRLVSAVITLSPDEVNFSPVSRKRPAMRLRPLWHQALLYTLVFLPTAAVAVGTGVLMLVRASVTAQIMPMAGLTLCAMMLFYTSGFLLYRALIAVITCPCISEEGVRAGMGIFMPWEDVRFGYVHRMGHVSGMFLLSQPLDEAGKRGAPPMLCLSVPDTSTLLLAYLTYCPHASKGMDA